MCTTTLTLKHFVKSVPVCQQTATVKALLACLQSSKAEAIALINEQGIPVSVLSLANLLTYMIKGIPVGVNFGQGNLPEGLGNQKLNTLKSLHLPILSFPDSMTVKDFLSYFPTENQESVTHSSVAIIDSSGQFLGMLDTWRLLKAVGNEVANGNPTQTNTRSHLGELFSLTELIEQLPLPLMLQQDDGTAIAQNSTWRQQLPELTHTEAIHLPVSPELPQLCVSETRPNFWCSLMQDQEVQPHCLTDTQAFAIKVSNEQLQDALESDCKPPLTAKKGVWQFTKLPLWQSHQQKEAQSPQPSVWLIVATDITEQQQLCKELAAKNADLMQLNRLKDEFLSCISHELKTPLTAVVGLSSLLKGQLLGQLNSRQARYVHLIHQSGRHLMSLVNDILDLTRLETGQLKLNPNPVKIKAVCDRAYQQALEAQSVKEQQEREADGNINFTLTIEPSLETVVADELRLCQMLVHLLSNALKFTQKGGEMGLKVSHWDGWIAFTVWDTGIGIPASSQHLIFQKFQQLENPLTRQFEGTGLGLVLTRRLARAHGGDVSFISKAGHGSQFTLLIPPFSQVNQQGWVENPPKEKQAVEPIPRRVIDSFPNRLILIVEAVPNYIEQLTGQLRRFGYRVANARSGTEALEKARQLQPCAILLNPILPLLSGWDVLTLLKADAQTQQIPVLITATRAEKQQAYHNGAEGFLTLPVQAQPLRDSLIALEEKRSLQEVLTILRLNVDEVSEASATPTLNSAFDFALNSYSSELHYRIIEADDLEQAEVLTRVWHPDVVLVNGEVSDNASIYWEALSQCKQLAKLPLVTLSPKMAEAANHLKRLSVFPCLVPLDQSNMTSVLEVIQVAAGMRNDKPVPG